ncbi:hypothetical protein EMIT0P218_40279 [Pseudomonas sp. IT-P218]
MTPTPCDLTPLVRAHDQSSAITSSSTVLEWRRSEVQSVIRTTKIVLARMLMQVRMFKGLCGI